MNQVQPISCPECRALLPWNLFNTGATGRCRRCNSQIFGVVFPALVRGVAPGKPGERILSDEDASCYYHAQKKAVVACDHCGRFLCALCDVDFGGRHLCPACIETGQGQRKIKSLENRRVLYDDMALAIAALPFIIPFLIYFSFILAPAALFIAVRHWNSPSSIIPRTKFRMVMAVMIALMEIAGWVLIIYFLFSRWS